MLFNSIQFIVFFTIVTTFYFVLPHALRWFLLLVASSIFYMAFVPKYILILFAIIIIDFFSAKIIAHSDGTKKKIFLIASLIANGGILFVFKYFNFFNANIAWLAHLLHWNYGISSLSILLPIGLSFHTFQSMSYIIEVYRGKQIPENNLGIYALYVLFFPQLVAGPIERPQNLLHQFHEQHRFDYERVTNGLKLMLWGAFKKVVIADRLALYVNSAYGHPDGSNSLTLVMATIFFAYQIYCDFSGYSDIAIGCAMVLGFNLSDNFNRPYSSRTVAEFWQRWHMSLFSWFRDYIFIPLGGNRMSPIKTLRNIFIVFIVSGFWHGANWTFVVWGLLNAAYIIVGHVTKTSRLEINQKYRLDRFPRLQNFYQVIITFALICFSWIFFRANSLGDAFRVVKGIAQFNSGNFLQTVNTSFLISIALIVFLELFQIVHREHSTRSLLSFKPTVVRLSVYAILLIAIAFFGQFNDAQQFIYFRF